MQLDAPSEAKHGRQASGPSAQVATQAAIAAAHPTALYQGQSDIAILPGTGPKFSRRAGLSFPF